ncbi:hypothetical protein V6N13_098597 [Hibiscus sabdariffa]
MQCTSSTLALGADGNDEASTCSTNDASPTHVAGPDEAGTCSTNDASPTHVAGPDEVVTCSTNAVSPARVPPFLPTYVDTTRMPPGNACPQPFIFVDSP